MDIEKTLGESTNSQSLIEGYFIINNLLTKLAIYPDQLHFSNPKLSCAYQINFDFSFDIVKQEHGWILSFRVPEQLQFFSYIELDTWEDILIKTIRRRRFHQFYQGIRKIGKGNFASVYLSKRISDGKLFAVKAFQKQSTFKPTNGKQALQNQINILRKLSHPNIIHLESVFQTQNSIYLIMELINGKSLGQILDEGKIIAPALRKKILKGIIAGLAQMQTHHILHRDIKPDNIMVDSNGQIKIIDFGLATQTQAIKYLYVRCGTPGYVAPEIITIKDIQQARMTTMSDVFSAGVLFYQMIFGKALFQGQTKTQILQKNRKCLFSIPTSSDQASFQQLIILRRMLDIYPHTRITASQALRLDYFEDKRESLKQINACQQNNQCKTTKCLPKLKNSTALTERPRRSKKVQQLNENKIN